MAEIVLERRHGLWPQGTDPFFVAFADELHLEGGLES